MISQMKVIKADGTSNQFSDCACSFNEEIVVMSQPTQKSPERSFNDSESRQSQDEETK